MVVCYLQGVVVAAGGDEQLASVLADGALIGEVFQSMLGDSAAFDGAVGPVVRTDGDSPGCQDAVVFEHKVPVAVRPLDVL